MSSSSSSSRKKNADAERRPALMSETFMNHLLHTAAAACSFPANASIFSLHSYFPTMHTHPYDEEVQQIGAVGKCLSPSLEPAAGGTLSSMPNTPCVEASESLPALPPSTTCSQSSTINTAQPISTNTTRLTQAGYEYVCLHIASDIADALSLETYWTDLTAQIRVDHLVFFVLYCTHQRFSALKSLHLLEFLLKYEDTVAAGSNKEGEQVKAAAEEAAARAAAAAALLEQDKAADPPQAVDAAAAATPRDGEPPGSKKGKAAEKKDDKKKTKPPSKKEKLAAIAAEEERKRREEEAVQLAVEAERQRVLAAERCLLSWDEVLQHTLKEFLTAELEAGWRWDQFPWQPQVKDPSPSAPSSSSGNKGKKKGGEKARLQQLQEQEEEMKRQAAAAELPRENLYLKEDEMPVFTSVFLARGLLQHAALYQYLSRHEAVEEAEGEPDTFQLSTEIPMAYIPPLWTARYMGSSTSPAAGAEGAAAGASPHSARGSGENNNPTSPSAVAEAATSPSPGAASPTLGDGAEGSSTSGSAGAGGGGVLEDRHREEVAELMAERMVELQRFEAAHKETVEREAERARMAEQERKMEILFADDNKNRVIEDVYDSLEEGATRRQLAILKRVEALERTLGITRTMSIPAALRKESAAAGPGSAGGAGSGAADKRKKKK